MRNKKKRSNLLKFIIALLMILIGSIFLMYSVFYPLKNYDIVKRYSEKYNLDPLLVMAVIKTESNFDKNAKSTKNAYGLMQITDTTAEWAATKMDIEFNSTSQLLNEEYNIRMGCWYLDNLREEFGSLDLIIAAYNGGRGNVEKWLNNEEHSEDGSSLKSIPFPETDKYVKKVNTNYKMYKLLYK